MQLTQRTLGIFSYMDSVFLLDGRELSTFFQHMIQDFGCTYLCLWLYSPQGPQSANCLRYKDGFYIERSAQPSSSSGTLAQRLFIEYQQSVFIPQTSHIPGLAFQNNLPYMELNSSDILALATTESQRQFYQEAGIKTVVFIGCNAGEIEMGISDDSQVNLEMKMRHWFPVNFSQAPLVTSTELLPQPTDQTRAASSSSSLRSLSYDSGEYSPLLFDIPASSYAPEPPLEATLQQALIPTPSSFTLAASPLQQAIRALSHMRRFQIPSIESEDAAMTKAILDVISSPASPSSTLQPQQTAPPAPHSYRGSERGSAFKSYRQSLGPRIPASDRQRRQNMQKRSIAFLRNLHTIRVHQERIQATRPPSTNHMIAERKRREKINESFQALRSFLPPGTKKDKASVLARTTEYLSSLKTRVEELIKRNQILEEQLLVQKAAAAAAEEATSDSSNIGEVAVRISHVHESTSEARIVDLYVTRREEFSNLDSVVRLLEFLRRDQNVSLVSMEANTTLAADSTSVNRIVMRLKIEGTEWDESAFQEAVKRIFN